MHEFCEFLHDTGEIFNYLFLKVSERESTVVFQPRDYEEFTRQLARDQSQSREGEVVTVDVSGATLQRMADYRR